MLMYCNLELHTSKRTSVGLPAEYNSSRVNRQGFTLFSCDVCTARPAGNDAVDAVMVLHVMLNPPWQRNQRNGVKIVFLR